MEAGELTVHYNSVLWLENYKIDFMMAMVVHKLY